MAPPSMSATLYTSEAKLRFCADQVGEIQEEWVTINNVHNEPIMFAFQLKVNQFALSSYTAFPSFGVLPAKSYINVKVTQTRVHDKDSQRESQDKLRILSRFIEDIDLGLVPSIVFQIFRTKCAAANGGTATLDIPIRFPKRIRKDWLKESIQTAQNAHHEIYYQSEENIASGGYGSIFRGYAKIHSPKGSRVCVVKVAIKTYLENGQDHNDIRSRESNVLELDHPNIIPCLGFREEPPTFFFPYMANGEVCDYIKRMGLGIKERRRLILDVVSALSYMHCLDPPLCHGDIKHNNVLVDVHGRAFLSDFGLSKKHAPNDPSTQPGEGLPHWMALEIRRPPPESQNSSPSPRSTESDVWAIGWLVLKLAFDMDPRTHILHTYQPRWKDNLAASQTSPSETCKELIRKCHSDLPRGRPQMSDVETQLKALGPEEWATSVLVLPQLGCERSRCDTGSVSLDEERTVTRAIASLTMQSALEPALFRLSIGDGPSNT